MTEQNNDYSKLRPFDLEAAKRGEPIVLTKDGDIEDRAFVTGPDDYGYFVVKTDDGWFLFGKKSDYRMAPLAWVEGKPVYKGDVLYWNRPGYHKFIATTLDDGYICGECDGYDSEKSTGMLAYSLTWNPPKVKREGWINIYPSDTVVGGFVGASGNIYQTESAALAACRGHEAVSIRIEWEE